MVKVIYLNYSSTIDCTTVLHSPCDQPKRHQPPLCGQVEAFSYTVLNKNINADDPSTIITINITFRSIINNQKIPLYFIAFYGDAQNFEREADVWFSKTFNVYIRLTY